MNEQLQSKLVEILSGIQSATKEAGDFAMEQLPDIAQQYVMYGRVNSLVWLFAWAVVFIAAVYMNFRFVRYMKNEDEWEMSPLLMATVSGAGGAGMVFMTCAQTAALVWFAPKVWLLKELASLIK